MKITLPTGTILEPENKEELRWVLAELGVTGSSPAPPTAAASATSAWQPPEAAVGDVGPESPSTWTKVKVEELLTKSAEGARRLIKVLLPRDLSNDEVAKLFNYTDNRPIGGLMGGLKTHAASLGLPSPVVSAEVNGERRLVLDPEFRRAMVARGVK